MVGKRVQFNDETWEAVVALAGRSGATFQELTEEAFADLTQKASAAGRANGIPERKRRRAKEGASHKEEPLEYAAMPLPEF